MCVCVACSLWSFGVTGKADVGVVGEDLRFQSHVPAGITR